MAWARIDDKFLDNPKVRKAGKEATYLYVSGLVYSSSQLTEGFVSDDALGLVAYKGFIKNEQTHAATLVECGLWDRVEGGWQIHDYLEYNPTKQQIEQAREKKATAGSKGAQARWQNDSKADGKTIADAIPSAITPAIANAWQGDSKPIALTHPIPSHPNPTPEKDKETAAAAAFYEANFGVLSSVIATEIDKAISDTSLDWVLDAMREAVTHDVRKWSYVAKVLSTWKGNGRKGQQVKQSAKAQAGSYEAWKACEL